VELRRHLRAPALVIGTLFAILAGCTETSLQPATSASASPNNFSQLGPAGWDPSPPKDPLWGNIVLPEPSPGDPGVLRVRVDGLDLVYTVHLPDLDGTKVVTYITRRLEDANDVLHKDEFLHMESDVPESHFEIRLSYKRFFHGNYTVTAHADHTENALGVRNFVIE
jgi:hypothetical protein